MNIKLKFSDTDLNFTGIVQVSTICSPIPLKVEYFIDNIFVLSKLSEPFPWNWDTTTVNDGPHVIRALATFKNGRQDETSQNVQIINTSPPADSTSPSVPGSFQESSDTENSITVTWLASTDNIAVTGYNLYKNNIFIATVDSSVTTYTFEGLNCGTTYVLSIEAFDERSNKSAFSTVSAATEDCPIPTIPTITSDIQSDAIITQGDTWTVTTDPDSELVEFWADGTRIGTDTTDPYTTVINLPIGIHKLGLCATLNGVRTCYGAGGVYADNVEIVAPTLPPPPPIVPIITSNVSNGTIVTQGDPWLVSVDPDATFVEFWADGTRFSTSSSLVEPHIANINLTPGTHNLGLCVTVNGVRTCYGPGGVFATITVIAPAVFAITQNISSGQILTGTIPWTASVSGKDATKVEFFIDGILKWTENSSPYEYNGDGGSLDTRTLTNASHSLKVKAYSVDGLTVEKIATVSVSNVIVSPPAGIIGWRGDFETNNFSQYSAVQEKAAGRASIVTSPARQGTYSARCEVRSGDNNVAGSGSGERCEWYSGAATNAVEGNEEFWGWSTRFDSTFTSSTSSWNYFLQFHNSGPAGQANVGFYAASNVIGLRICSGSDPFNPTVRWYTISNTRVNNQWYDFVFRIKWSRSNSVGLIQVWLNGVVVVPISMGANLYINEGAYLKQGFYRNAFGSTAILYHDGTRRGNSYEIVAAEFS